MRRRRKRSSAPTHSNDPPSDCTPSVHRIGRWRADRSRRTHPPLGSAQRNRSRCRQERKNQSRGAPRRAAAVRASVGPPVTRAGARNRARSRARRAWRGPERCAGRLRRGRPDFPVFRGSERRYCPARARGAPRLGRPRRESLRAISSRPSSGPAQHAAEGSGSGRRRNTDRPQPVTSPSPCPAPGRGSGWPRPVISQGPGQRPPSASSPSRRAP